MPFPRTGNALWKHCRHWRTHPSVVPQSSYSRQANHATTQDFFGTRVASWDSTSDLSNSRARSNPGLNHSPRQGRRGPPYHHFDTSPTSSVPLERGRGRKSGHLFSLVNPDEVDKTKAIRQLIKILPYEQDVKYTSWEGIPLFRRLHLTDSLKSQVGSAPMPLQSTIFQALSMPRDFLIASGDPAGVTTALFLGLVASRTVTRVNEDHSVMICPNAYTVLCLKHLSNRLGVTDINFQAQEGDDWEPYADLHVISQELVPLYMRKERVWRLKSLFMDDIDEYIDPKSPMTLRNPTSVEWLLYTLNGVGNGSLHRNNEIIADTKTVTVVASTQCLARSYIKRLRTERWMQLPLLITDRHAEHSMKKELVVIDDGKVVNRTEKTLSVDPEHRNEVWLDRPLSFAGGIAKSLYFCRSELGLLVEPEPSLFEEMIKETIGKCVDPAENMTRALIFVTQGVSLSELRRELYSKWRGTRPKIQLLSELFGLKCDGNAENADGGHDICEQESGDSQVSVQRQHLILAFAENCRGYHLANISHIFVLGAPDTFVKEKLMSTRGDNLFGHKTIYLVPAAYQQYVTTCWERYGSRMEHEGLLLSDFPADAGTRRSDKEEEVDASVYSEGPGGREGDDGDHHLEGRPESLSPAGSLGDRSPPTEPMEPTETGRRPRPVQGSHHRRWGSEGVRSGRMGALRRTRRAAF